MPNDDYFVSVELQRTNRKIGKTVTLYKRELLKKVPRLGTFCTQTVNEELNNVPNISSPFLVSEEQAVRKQTIYAVHRLTYNCGAIGYALLQRKINNAFSTSISHVTMSTIKKIKSVAQQCFYGEFMSLTTIKRN